MYVTQPSLREYMHYSLVAQTSLPAQLQEKCICPASCRLLFVTSLCCISPKAMYSKRWNPTFGSNSSLGETIKIDRLEVWGLNRFRIWCLHREVVYGGSAHQLISLSVFPKVMQVQLFTGPLLDENPCITGFRPGSVCSMLVLDLARLLSPESDHAYLGANFLPEAEEYSGTFQK